METINLFVLTRLADAELDIFKSTLKVISELDEMPVIREHEKKDLKSFVELIFNLTNDVFLFDEFYYSYTIPQISQEFDLLKFSKNKILNIELKHQFVELDKIIYQLKKNKYHLSHLEKEIVSITYIAENNTFYFLQDDILKKIKIDKVVEILKIFQESYKVKLIELFKPKNFLVAPLNNPKKFLNNNYFLTSQQEEIKNIITTSIDSDNLYYQISGSAGTGKTLLLYDMARTLSKSKKVCIIHGGVLCEGHKKLQECLGIEILSPKTATDFDFNNYEIICVDESHRIHKELFDKLKSLNKRLIFSLDGKQILSQKEETANISTQVCNLKNIKSFRLTNKIRTNKEVVSFITKLFDLSKYVAIENFDNIEIYYCNGFINYFYTLWDLKDRNYYFISYTLSNYKKSFIDNYDSEKNGNTHTVVGQEFDNVVMVLDKNFYYENNKLKARPHAYKNYKLDKLLYQGLTRARDKLALIVFRNRKLYEILCSLINDEKFN